MAEVLDAYAARDISFKLADETLTPSRSDSSFFYKFLSRNTNIPRSVPTHPADVNLVEHLTPTKSVKPDIFIIVIDSLRRDYVSSYNPAVNFTPSMDAFGRESVVMQNAFTRYGGTGLSEPSIWVGGMILHQQYVTPFYPMNALAKLLETDGYKGFVSKDAILSAIVPPSPSVTDMDEGTAEKDLDLCRSLTNLQNKIGAEHDPNVPLFAYTQPQNIHISVIHREGESVLDGESYPGFYAPYASRLKRIDACFGSFVQFLKASGRYEKSIIILTADHGDSLGEGGRWGHAYTLFPEIVEVPLIIHLPQAMQAGLSVDPRTLAFLTDITPTLYYVLGHRPIVRNELFGRPLFMEKPGEEAPYLRDSYLMASSYGPVYGLLKNQGHSLYVADGVNYKDYLFDLQDSLGMNRRVSLPIREENEKTIHDGIVAIGHFYQFQ
jgi:arylsulfatase A-like enzyme